MKEQIFFQLYQPRWVTVRQLHGDASAIKVPRLDDGLGHKTITVKRGQAYLGPSGELIVLV